MVQLGILDPRDAISDDVCWVPLSRHESVSTSNHGDLFSLLATHATLFQRRQCGSKVQIITSSTPSSVSRDLKRARLPPLYRRRSRPAAARWWRCRPSPPGRASCTRSAWQTPSTRPPPRSPVLPRRASSDRSQPGRPWRNHACFRSRRIQGRWLDHTASGMTSAAHCFG